MWTLCKMNYGIGSNRGMNFWVKSKLAIPIKYFGGLSDEYQEVSRDSKKNFYFVENPLLKWLSYKSLNLHNCWAKINQVLFKPTSAFVLKLRIVKLNVLQWNMDNFSCLLESRDKIYSWSVTNKLLNQENL